MIALRVASNHVGMRLPLNIAELNCAKCNSALFHSGKQHLSDLLIVWRIRGKIFRTAVCCIVYYEFCTVICT